MKEPSEKGLDLHYKTQCTSYDFTHKRKVSASDQILIVNWLRIFNKVPKEQKLARNSLMLLMYGHLEEFGYLQLPFVDEQNYKKDLNELVDSYTGLSIKGKTNNNDDINDKTSMEQQIIYMLRNSVNQKNSVQPKERREPLLPRHRKEGKLCKISTLQPIKEISESSEMEPSTSHLSVVTVITKNDEERDITYDSHRCYKEESLVQIEKEKLKNVNKNHELVNANKQIPLQSKNEESKIKLSTVMVCPSCQSKRETDIPNIEMSKRTSSMNLIKDKNNSRNSQQAREKIMAKEMDSSSPEIDSLYSSKCLPKAVRSLKVCFDKISETDSDQYPNTSMEQEDKIKEGISTLPKQLVIHQKIGTDITERLRQLRKRNEELREICLKYYNMDGSLKPSHLSKIKAKRIQGFLIGAHRALKRLQRWHGLPHRLGFFATCFKYTGVGLGQWRWRAIDRNLEKVTHKWFRNTLQQSQQHAWHSYREIMLNQNLPKTAETLRLLNQITNSRRELILERMSHLQQLKQLIIQECEYKINPIQLQKMLKYLESKCRLLAEDLHLLACQQQQLKLKSK